MSGSETNKDISPKRKRMMDMIVALGGLREEETIPQSQVDQELANLKNKLSPLMESILSFPGLYFKEFLKHAERIDFTKEIGDLLLLSSAADRIDNAVTSAEIDGLNEILRILRQSELAMKEQAEKSDSLNKAVDDIKSSLDGNPEAALAKLQKLGIKTRYGDPPCYLACPAGVHGQKFVNLTRDGHFKEGMEHMRDVYPFAGTLGRVCSAPCETKCQRGRIDQPVSIRNLHRFLADYEMSRGPFKTVKPKLDKDKKVAVVGAGPAGIACAYDLVRMGYPVTIFESREKTGGLLRYGIPEYRLPHNIIDYEVAFVESLGVEIKTGSSVKEPGSLLKKGYDAVFIATGAWASRKLRVDGEDAKGVFHALEFLEDVNNGKRVKLGKKVAIIGGGNAAIDSARVSHRLGAEEVLIVYRRSREEMPAIPEEIHEAELEGIKLHILSSPVKILESGGKVTGLRCIKMELGEPDESGRRRPVPIPDSEFDIDLDAVVVAIGQGIDEKDYFSDVEYSRWGWINADENTLQTCLDGIFAGGDCVTGPSTVVDAVGSGKQAALSISRYLQGEDTESVATDEVRIAASVEIEMSQATEDRRAEMPALKPSKRGGFDEVELGFKRKTAKIEADRCINCSLSNMGVNVYGERLDPEVLETMMETYVQDEAEKGLLYLLIREQGATTVDVLAKKTGLPKDRIFLHMVTLKRNEVLTTLGEDRGYIIYDVQRTPSTLELALRDISDLALKLAEAKTELEKITEEIRPQDIGRLANALETFSRARDKLEGVEVDGSIVAGTALKSVEEKVRSAVLLTYRTRAKLPSTRPKVSVSDLKDLDVPSVLEEYKSQMGYAPLLGFGTIEWKHSRCLGCKSCEISCPEDAIELKPVLRLPEIFEFTDEEMDELPVNRALFYETVKSLATNKPSDNVLVPEDAPGFGTVEVDLWLCVACRTCVRRCPGPEDGALELELKWSLPEVVKKITSET
ncbi:4Fe-4S dicluster domain-containing protein [Candidatus Thorarchaeota archaeon]|nr:MAG: 4Fe-4S dicluster domain-containing protein [Candidatus Thorarchaeota archaeon]